MAEDSVPKKIVTLNVKSGTIIGSTYSQVAGVTVTDNEVTIEFVYINPQIRTEGQTVARITMPRKSAQELAKIIPETITKHESKKSASE